MYLNQVLVFVMISYSLLINCHFFQIIILIFNNSISLIKDIVTISASDSMPVNGHSVAVSATVLALL